MRYSCWSSRNCCFRINDTRWCLDEWFIKSSTWLKWIKRFLQSSFCFLYNDGCIIIFTTIIVLFNLIICLPNRRTLCLENDREVVFIAKYHEKIYNKSYQLGSYQLDHFPMYILGNVKKDEKNHSCFWQLRLWTKNAFIWGMIQNFFQGRGKTGKKS